MFQAQKIASNELPCHQGRNHFERMPTQNPKGQCNNGKQCVVKQIQIYNLDR